MSRGSESPAPAKLLAGVAPYAGTALAVVLAWQIGLQPLIQRAPVEAAIRLAPTSPAVLRRAAESELAAGRNENAAALGRDALARSPFDVRALRIVGLSEAKAGREDSADDLLTLAGNWSLRDDPTHLWLVGRRLRRGDYNSSFAHADTLIRRRQEHRPGIFRLFTTAVREDPKRVYPVLDRLLSANPPWRTEYFASLHESLEGVGIAANLAIMLNDGPAPLTNAELRQLYLVAMSRHQVGLVSELRNRLNRPPKGALVVNGDFSDPESPEPFQWLFIQMAGASAAVTPDDAAPDNPALRVEYDGYSTAALARQQIFLEPGRYRLTASSRIESGEPRERLAWSVSCGTGERGFLFAPAVADDAAIGKPWKASTATFYVPAGCASQWIELRGRPQDTRSPMVVWFDQISITAVETRAEKSGE